MEGFISRGFISVDDEPRPLLQSKRIEDKMLNPESRLSYPPRAYPVAISSATDNSRVHQRSSLIPPYIHASSVMTKLDRGQRHPLPASIPRDIEVN